MKKRLEDNSEMNGASSHDEPDELRGALPPSEARNISPGPRSNMEDLKQAEGFLPRWFKHWGPWKRWARYREIRDHDRADSMFWRDQDTEENESGRLPDEEGVQVPAIWIVELYTPSTVGGLIKRARRVGLGVRQD